MTSRTLFLIDIPASRDVFFGGSQWIFHADVPGGHVSPHVVRIAADKDRVRPVKTNMCAAADGGGQQQQQECLGRAEKTHCNGPGKSGYNTDFSRDLCRVHVVYGSG